MDHYSAQNIIENDHTQTPYISADYYRMEDSSDIALVLLDTPDSILKDLVVHGSDEDRERLVGAVSSGFVIATKCEAPDGAMNDSYSYHIAGDVKGAPPLYTAHLAMQLAFPNPYIAYFEGETVWSYEDSRMFELIAVAIACMANPKSPSDFFGSHYVPDTAAKRPVGRPADPNKVKAQPVDGFKAWVEACQERKSKLSALWMGIITAREEKNKKVKGWELWLEYEVNELEVQIASRKNKIKSLKTGIKAQSQVLADEIKEKQLEHTVLKMSAKPLKSDYVNNLL